MGPRSRDGNGAPPLRRSTRNSIRKLRFEHDEMTQEELAHRVGCTRQTIIALEQGRYVPSLELSFRIARAFGLTADDVLEYEW